MHTRKPFGALNGLTKIFVMKKRSKQISFPILLFSLSNVIHGQNRSFDEKSFMPSCSFLSAIIQLVVVLFNIYLVSAIF